MVFRPLAGMPEHVRYGLACSHQVPGSPSVGSGADLRWAGRGGLQVNSSSRNAQQRPKCKLRRHSIMRRSSGRFTSAQRRPECKLWRHMPIRLPLATPSPALNEGRSASSGDPSAHCIECSGRLLTAQQRPERKLQRHLASTVLSCASLPRSTKARVQTPATLLDFGQDTRLKPLCATYQFSGSFARSIWTLLHMQSRLFCMLAQLNKLKSNHYCPVKNRIKSTA